MENWLSSSVHECRLNEIHSVPVYTPLPRLFTIFALASGPPSSLPPELPTGIRRVCVRSVIEPFRCSNRPLGGRRPPGTWDPVLSRCWIPLRRWSRGSFDFPTVFPTSPFTRGCVDVCGSVDSATLLEGALGGADVSRRRGAAPGRVGVKKIFVVGRRAATARRAFRPSCSSCATARRSGGPKGSVSAWLRVCARGWASEEDGVAGFYRREFEERRPEAETRRRAPRPRWTMFHFTPPSPSGTRPSCTWFGTHHGRKRRDGDGRERSDPRP